MKFLWSSQLPKCQMWRHLSFWCRAETTCPPRLGKTFLGFIGFWSGNKVYFGECVCSMFAGDVWHDVCVFCFALSGARLCYSFVWAWAVLAILTLCFLPWAVLGCGFWAGAVLAVLMKKPVGLIWSFWGCLCYFDGHSVECLVDFPPFSEPSGFLSYDWWREGHMTGVSGFSHRLGLSSVRPVDELMLRFVTAWRAEFCDGTTCGVLVGKCIVFEDCALYARPFLSRLAFSTVIGRERTTWQRCLVTGVECWSEGLHWSLK